jgi:Zn-finger nucleic acid-binding protein
MNCPRCETVELETTSSDVVKFFACPQCGRHFRATSDGKLVEKWLGPLSLVLYPVIFEKQPQKEAGRIADELYAASDPGRRSMFRPFARDKLKQMLSEIQMELEHPTQKIRDILDAQGEEADLREYIALVAERLGGLLAGGETPDKTSHTDDGEQ